jgi:hypothetical protein
MKVEVASYKEDLEKLILEQIAKVRVNLPTVSEMDDQFF